MNGQVGHVPSNYVEMLPDQAPQQVQSPSVSPQLLYGASQKTAQVVQQDFPGQPPKSRSAPLQVQPSQIPQSVPINSFDGKVTF